jgi:hypothetical protein
MDDVFQKKQVAGGSENEGFTVIRAVSNWPFPLNFADVESKGRWYFSSKLMIGTTNVDNISSAVQGVLAAPEAVVRRINHGYWIELRPDYVLDGRLDYVKLERVHTERKAALKDLGRKPTVEEVLACYPWEAFMLKRHRFDCGHTTAQPYPGTLLDVAKEIADELRVRENSHKMSTEGMLDCDDVRRSEPLSEDAASGDGLRPLRDWTRGGELDAADEG